LINVNVVVYMITKNCVHLYTNRIKVSDTLTNTIYGLVDFTTDSDNDGHSIVIKGSNYSQYGIDDFINESITI